MKKQSKSMVIKAGLNTVAAACMSYSALKLDSEPWVSLAFLALAILAFVAREVLKKEL